MSVEASAWALEQMFRLETATRDLNNRVEELEAEIRCMDQTGSHRDGSRMAYLVSAEEQKTVRTDPAAAIDDAEAIAAFIEKAAVKPGSKAGS